MQFNSKSPIDASSRKLPVNSHSLSRCDLLDSNECDIYSVETTPVSSQTQTDSIPKANEIEIIVTNESKSVDENKTEDIAIDTCPSKRPRGVNFTEGNIEYATITPSDLSSADVASASVAELNDFDQNVCCVCNTNNNDEDTLLCDAVLPSGVFCNKPYHTYCLSPPLEKVPDDDWFCPECVSHLQKSDAKLPEENSRKIGSDYSDYEIFCSKIKFSADEKYSNIVHAEAFVGDFSFVLRIFRDEKTHIVIKNIRKDLSFYNKNCISNGDNIVKINGMAVKHMSKDDIARLLVVNDPNQHKEKVRLHIKTNTFQLCNEVESIIEENSNSNNNSSNNMSNNSSNNINSSFDTNLNKIGLNEDDRMHSNSSNNSSNTTSNRNNNKRNEEAAKSNSSLNETKVTNSKGRTAPFPPQSNDKSKHRYHFDPTIQYTSIDVIPSKLYSGLDSLVEHEKLQMKANKIIDYTPEFMFYMKKSALMKKISKNTRVYTKLKGDSEFEHPGHVVSIELLNRGELNVWVEIEVMDDTSLLKSWYFIDPQVVRLLFDPDGEDLPIDRDNPFAKKSRRLAALQVGSVGSSDKNRQNAIDIELSCTQFFKRHISDDNFEGGNYLL